MAKDYLTVGELRRLLEAMPAYYDDMPVELVVENKRFPIIEAKASEKQITTKVYANALDLVCNAKLVKKPEPKKEKKDP